MVRDEENGGRLIEIAVTSFRVNTGRCGQTEAGFTKITYSILSWIESILQGGMQKDFQSKKLKNLLQNPSMWSI